MELDLNKLFLLLMLLGTITAIVRGFQRDMTGYYLGFFGVLLAGIGWIFT